MCVLSSPCFADAAVGELEEVHLRHPMETSASGWMAQPVPGVSTGAEESSSDGVVLSDKLDDLHVKVAERGTKWRDPGACWASSAGSVNLIQHLEVAADHHLVHKAPNRSLVVFEWTRRHAAQPPGGRESAVELSSQRSRRIGVVVD